MVNLVTKYSDLTGLQLAAMNLMINVLGINNTTGSRIFRSLIPQISVSISHGATAANMSKLVLEMKTLLEW